MLIVTEDDVHGSCSTVDFKSIRSTPTNAASNAVVRIVHPESFRSNAQNAIVFARRNRPRVNWQRSFACVNLRAFASTVCDRVHARTCVQSHLRACEVHLIKDHQIKLRAHAQVYTRTYMYVRYASKKT